MSNTSPNASEYLALLRGALEALGPKETQEVITEIEGLLAEATADGDEAALLVSFGPSDAFAARILEERGIASGASRVPEAPAGVRMIAVAIDVGLSLATAILLYAVIELGRWAITYWGYSTPLVTAVEWIAFVALLGGLSWWWIKSRPQVGRASTGMEVAGVRKIRVGETTRIVRNRDIPGLGKGRRVIPKVKMGSAVLVLALSILSIAYMGNLESENRTEKAVFDCSACANVVSNVYRQVLEGAGASSLWREYEPDAEDDMTALMQRYAEGEFTSYAVEFARLPDGAAADSDALNSSSDIIVLVGIREYNEEDGTMAVYEYTVNCILDHKGDGSATGQLQIASVTPIEG